MTVRSPQLSRQTSFFTPREDTVSLAYILYSSWLDTATLSLLQAQWIYSVSVVVTAEANYLLG